MYERCASVPTIASGSVANITRCTIAYCHVGGWAGAIGTFGDAFIQDSTFEHNEAGSYGGDMLVASGARVEVVRTVFAGARAGWHGGSICLEGGGSATFADSTFLDAQAGTVGGLARIFTAARAEFVRCSIAATTSPTSVFQLNDPGSSLSIVDTVIANIGCDDFFIGFPKGDPEYELGGGSDGMYTADQLEFLASLPGFGGGRRSLTTLAGRRSLASLAVTSLWVLFLRWRPLLAIQLTVFAMVPISCISAFVLILVVDPSLVNVALNLLIYGAAIPLIFDDERPKLFLLLEGSVDVLVPQPLPHRRPEGAMAPPTRAGGLSPSAGRACTAGDGGCPYGASGGDATRESTLLAPVQEAARVQCRGGALLVTLHATPAEVYTIHEAAVSSRRAKYQHWWRALCVPLIRMSVGATSLAQRIDKPVTMGSVLCDH